MCRETGPAWPREGIQSGGVNPALRLEVRLIKSHAAFWGRLGGGLSGLEESPGARGDRRRQRGEGQLWPASDLRLVGAVLPGVIGKAGDAVGVGLGVLRRQRGIGGLVGLVGMVPHAGEFMRGFVDDRPGDAMR
jgi:hypothetical protein